MTKDPAISAKMPGFVSQPDLHVGLTTRSGGKEGVIFLEHLCDVVRKSADAGFKSIGR